MGCFWYYAAKINNFEEGTWVYELGLSEQSPAELYITSVYWAVATIATVGFGDIHAFNELEQLIAIFWMIFGVGFYSFTVGSLSTLLSSLDTRSSHLQNKITFMDEFCQDTKLPKSLKDKIRRVLEYNSLVNIFSQTERDDFLLDIPLFLKFQIAQAMYAGLKERVPFFKNKDPVFISTFIPKLKPFKLQLGEFVYQKGEYPNLGIAN
jgi:hyperpolarization activated cyclic nucleotide-gated potassium channel 1